MTIIAFDKLISPLFDEMTMDNMDNDTINPYFPLKCIIFCKGKRIKAFKKRHEAEPDPTLETEG